MKCEKFPLALPNITFKLNHFFLQLGFTPSKAEKLLPGMGLQGKEAQKD